MPRPSYGWEVSQAAVRDVFFATMNYWAVFSPDLGKTLVRINPYEGLETADGGFCCDQRVEYDPRTNIFFWLRQTKRKNGANRYRLGVATPEQLVSTNGRGWIFGDLAGANYNDSGAFLDYPDFSVGENYLYLSFSSYSAKAKRSVVFRLPLAQLARVARRETSTVPAMYLETLPNHAYAVTAHATGTRAIIAETQDTSHLALWAWDEAGGVYLVTRGIPAVSADLDSRLPNDANWVGASSKLYWFTITGATRRGDEAWFAWTAGKDARFKQPHVEIAIVSTADLTVLRMSYIWNNGFAFAWPSLATNSVGEIGVAFQWGGGGSSWSNSAVGILTGERYLVRTTNQSNAASGGHYITANRWYGRARCFTVGSYYQKPIEVANHPFFGVFRRRTVQC
jgi:hypothetical protein